MQIEEAFYLDVVNDPQLAVEELQSNGKTYLAISKNRNTPPDESALLRLSTCSMYLAAERRVNEKKCDD